MVGKGVNGNKGRRGKSRKPVLSTGLGISFGAARPAKPAKPAEATLGKPTEPAKPAVLKVVSRGVNGNIGRSGR